MATNESQRPDSPKEGRIPVMQEIYDNVWFLFLLSLGIILIFYIIWGLIDLVNVPVIS